MNAFILELFEISYILQKCTLYRTSWQYFKIYGNFNRCFTYAIQSIFNIYVNATIATYNPLFFCFVLMSLLVTCTGHVLILITKIPAIFYKFIQFTISTWNHTQHWILKHFFFVFWRCLKKNYYKCRMGIFNDYLMFEFLDLSWYFEQGRYVSA